MVGRNKKKDALFAWISREMKNLLEEKSGEWKVNQIDASRILANEWKKKNPPMFNKDIFS